MPIVINSSLPAFEILKNQAVFEMSLERAEHQDIRPLYIGILNLMPGATVERTEVQLLRLLSNTPLQIHPVFIYFDEHKSGSKQDHFDSFYKTISEVKSSGLDGLIITGANLEDPEFEEVFYWKELTSFFDWATGNITSTIYLCWATHAGLYHHYNVQRTSYDHKKFGVFEHSVNHASASPFLAGLDDTIMVPHSRWKGIESSQIANIADLEVLIESMEAGPHLVVGKDGREIYMQGHPEYDRDTLAGEYFRDKNKGIPILPPQNYFPNDDDTLPPQKNWTANAQVFYSNWVNWVYQTTNFDPKKPLMDILF